MEDEVVVVEKNHPDQKGDCGDEVFIFEGFEEFHGSTNKVNAMFLIFLLSTLHPQWKSQILSIR
jgi:hypothetical protein